MSSQEKNINIASANNDLTLIMQNCISNFLNEKQIVDILSDNSKVSLLILITIVP